VQLLWGCFMSKYWLLVSIPSIGCKLVDFRAWNLVFFIMRMLRLMLRTILTLNPASVVASDDRPGDKSRISEVKPATLALFSDRHCCLISETRTK
jgi:hypothetical protein